MVLPDWFWVTFTFAFGACVGSFLNVVVYRLPRDKSLVCPPSACPACGRHIKFYDNIPLISWLLLGRKCRYCKEPISPRYFIIELITGLIFVFTYYLFFRSDLRAGVPIFLSGGWIIYLATIVLLSMLIAASAIDMELWIIPLSLCWFVTVVGFAASAVGPILIDTKLIRGYRLLPYASAKTGALAFGAAIGLIVSLILAATGILKRSYEFEESQESDIPPNLAKPEQQATGNERRINHRLEVMREVLFLSPVVIFALIAYQLTMRVEPVGEFWLGFSSQPVVAGLLGSIFAYFIGCGTVWATRILGTLMFGKEAMGLGDVHLMGSVGAVIGALPVVVAFFVAPFFGLGWALVQLFFKKSREIPYGPFLSLAAFLCIIIHNRIYGYFAIVLDL